MSKYRVIGVMSGTSLDGIDIVYVTFTFKDQWQFKIHFTETIPYSDQWRTELKQLVTLSPDKLKGIDKDYSRLLSTAISNFIDKHDIDAIDAICSHGHTALHRSEMGLTFQIGNLPNLAEELQQIVVCDFRPQDVALGGQGAPLVPIGDHLLFPEYHYCLNLGGFANVSTIEDDSRIAYDICPVNIVMNHYTAQLGMNYDNEGQMASTGQLNETLLHELNNLDFYRQSYPKSLGFEWVKYSIIPLIDKYQLSVNDILRTFAEHVAVQISRVMITNTDSSILITGGGVFNSF